MKIRHALSATLAALAACSIAKASVWEVTKVNIYFIGVLFAVLMMVTCVPITGLGLVPYFYP